MSIFDDLTNIFGNPFGTMAFTTPDSLVGQAGTIGGLGYFGSGLMGLGGGAAADPFSAASGDELTQLFGGGSSGGGGLFEELGLPDISGGLPILSDIANLAGLFGGGDGGSANATLAKASKDPNLALRVLPGVMALTYAGSQPGVDLGQLNNVNAQLAGNQNAVIKAATDPLERNIASGYGDLLQSQALRGIRGSSFGDASIGNYVAQTGNALANAGANAAQGSLALQGDLASRIASLKNDSQKLKNQLYGTAFDVLGRGLNPQGYAANISGGGGLFPVGGVPQGGAQGNPLNSLISLGGSLVNGIGGSVGKIVNGIGDALGGLF